MENKLIKKLFAHIKLQFKSFPAFIKFLKLVHTILSSLHALALFRLSSIISILPLLYDFGSAGLSLIQQTPKRTAQHRTRSALALPPFYSVAASLTDEVS